MRKKLFTKKNSQLYIKLFLSLITCIVVTTIISSSVLYVKFRDIARNIVYSDNLDSMAQTSNEVSTMTEMARTLSSQIYSDLYISKLLYFSEPDVYDITPAINQLGSYKVSMPFIDSIYLYNSSTETFFASTNNEDKNIDGLLGSTHEKTNFADRDIIRLIDNIEQYRIYEPIPRCFTFDVPGSEFYSCYTFLYYDPFAYDETSSGVVFVNIAESWIHDVMTASAKSPLSDTFIIDSTGRLASNSKNDRMLTDLSSRSYIQYILSHADTSGYLIDSVSGTKSFITYTSPDSLGWRYIRVTPYDVIFSDVEQMTHHLITICSIILLLSFLLAFAVSRQLSRPIDKKLVNLKLLEMERYNRNKILKQEYLSNLLLGRESTGLPSLQKNFREYDICLQPEGNLLMVLLRIDRYGELSRQHSIEDLKLYRFGIGNIAAELCSARFSAEAVDMGEDRIVLLLNPNGDDMALESAEFRELLFSFPSHIREFVDASVSITVGPAEGLMEKAAALYNQLLEASNHRLFYGYGCIIRSQDIMRLKEKEYVYPMQKEKQLMEAILSYDTETMKSLYREIVNDTVNYPFAVVNFVVSHLALTVSNTINIVCKNNSLLFQPDIRISVLNAGAIDTLEEVNGRFFRLFDEMKLMLDGKRSMKHENLVHSINNIIYAEYENPDLCLNTIADKLNMSPSYISKLYKQKTLKTIPDYLMEVRMDKAKDLLQKTQYPITKIAEKIGLANCSYFFKTFKKLNGVTPADFRKSAGTA
jgi:AraC-like DNA-binding protein